MPVTIAALLMEFFPQSSFPCVPRWFLSQLDVSVHALPVGLPMVLSTLEMEHLVPLSRYKGPVCGCGEKMSFLASVWTPGTKHCFLKFKDVVRSQAILGPLGLDVLAVMRGPVVSSGTQMDHVLPVSEFWPDVSRRPKRYWWKITLFFLTGKFSTLLKLLELLWINIAGI